jgi:hypothetical protein
VGAGGHVAAEEVVVLQLLGLADEGDGAPVEDVDVSRSTPAPVLV